MTLYWSLLYMSKAGLLALLAMLVLMVIFVQLSEPDNLNQWAFKVLLHFYLLLGKNKFSSSMLLQDFISS